MTAPPPVQGGSSLYCPWRQWDPQQGGVIWCTWTRRSRNHKALARYRRHWARHHA